LPFSPVLKFNENPDAATVIKWVKLLPVTVLFVFAAVSIIAGVLAVGILQLAVFIFLGLFFLISVTLAFLGDTMANAIPPLYCKAKNYIKRKINFKREH